MPDGNAAAHRVLSNAKILRDIGYEVIFISINKVISYNETKPIEKKIQGFSVYEKPYPKSNRHWFHYLTSTTYLKEIINQTGKQNIHSIIVYNPPSAQQIRIRNICKSIHANFILDLTEWYKVSTGNFIFRTLKNTDSNFRMKFLNSKSDGIITISKFLNNYYRKSMHTVLIPPLVDKKEEKWPRNIQKPGNIKTLTTIGIPNQNKESLLQIFKVLLDLKEQYEFVFNIIGVSRNDIESVEPETKNLIDKLGSRITFLGRLTNLDSIKQISKAHFFVFLRYESIVTQAGFPTKFVESISAGTPVLTNRTSNLNDFFVEGKNGFWLNPEDSGNLRKQMEKVLNMEEEEIHRMKEYCLKSKQFNYLNFVDDMKAFMIFLS